MKYTTVLYLFASSLVVGCAVEPSAVEPGEVDEAFSPATSALLTKGDTDVPAECQGILTYVNTASLAALDAVLPSDVASAIVARRATKAFFDLIDLSSVSGIAQARLLQIVTAARAGGHLTTGCAGVYEELAVSVDDQNAILAYINTAPTGELEQVVRFQAESTVPALLAGRPFGTLQALADTFGVGLETFRSIRDAAIDSPFDLLADSVNSATSDSTLVTAFDVFDMLVDQPGHPRGLTCFGIDPQLVANFGGTLRPSLANSAEVVSEVTSSVNFANRFGRVTGVSAGLADLSTLVAGQTFAGCYMSFEPDPWSGVNRAFFVNVRTGYRILTETRWSE